jgi:hypothetical protein
VKVCQFCFAVIVNLSSNKNIAQKLGKFLFFLINRFSFFFFGEFGQFFREPIDVIRNKFAANDEDDFSHLVGERSWHFQKKPGGNISSYIVFHTFDGINQQK